MNQLFGKYIIITGIILIVVGLVVLLADKIPFLGKLPGDIYVRGKSGSFYFPVVSCVVISVVLTIILNIFFRK
jgi:hypothetical protein